MRILDWEHLLLYHQELDKYLYLITLIFFTRRPVLVYGKFTSPWQFLLVFGLADYRQLGTLDCWSFGRSDVRQLSWSVERLVRWWYARSVGDWVGPWFDYSLDPSVGYSVGHFLDCRSFGRNDVRQLSWSAEPLVRWWYARSVGHSVGPWFDYCRLIFCIVFRLLVIRS